MELLIVIVILGVLATVTVFAVRGITDQGQDNAEATDLRALETAVESYYALNQQNPPDQAALVTAGLLQETSSLHTYTDNGDGTYTITSNSGGPGGGGGGGGAPAGTYAGLPIADQFGTVGASRVHVVFGGASGRANWESVTAANPALAADTIVYFIDITEVTTTAQVDAIVAGGAIDFAIWRPDDTFDFGGRNLESSIDLAIFAFNPADGASWGVSPGVDIGVFISSL